MWDILPYKSAYKPLEPIIKLKPNPTNYYDRFAHGLEGRDSIVNITFYTKVYF